MKALRAAKIAQVEVETCRARRRHDRRRRGRHSPPAKLFYRSQSGAHLRQAAQDCRSPASPPSRSSSPSATTWATSSPTPCAATPSASRKKRSSRSTASCVPAIRRPSTPRPRSSKACSSIRASTTSRASAASSSTSSSTRTRTPPRLDHRTLTPEDFYATIRYLLKLRKNIGIVDDIDHLGNRRVRAVGELMENQFRIGLVRMERAIKEKMSRLPGDVDGHAARPHQRQAGHGRHPRVLRLLAALAVHGPDQPALGDHAQAPSLRPWAGRSLPRARRIRSPRRAPHALRPYLPDRDAGRSEHRPHQLALLLRAHQRVRLHRVALPPRARTAACSTTSQVTNAGESGLRVRAITSR